MILVTVNSTDNGKLVHQHILYAATADQLDEHYDNVAREYGSEYAVTITIEE